MISYRQADLFDSFRDSQVPPVDVDFHIQFPTEQNGNAHGRKNGRYYAVTNMHVKVPASDMKTTDKIVERVELALGKDGHPLWGDIYSEEDETFDDFSRRVRNEYMDRLAPISETTPVSNGHSVGRYELVIKLKIKPI
jgi:hypothetical protein